MTYTKAIIAAGGWGTRFGIASVSSEKTMALVDGKPVLQHVVEDCVAAGITQITLVVGAMSQQTRLHFGGNPAYEDYLARKGKLELLEAARQVRTMADFRFIEQPEGAYGTTVPLWLARDFVRPGDEFLYLVGDQLCHHTDGRSEAQNLIEHTRKAGTDAGMLGVPVPWEAIHKYGIIKTRSSAADDTPMYDCIVEKPAVGSIDSNLNNASFYAVTSDFMGYVERNMAEGPANKDSEHRVTDAFNAYAADGHSIAVVPTAGRYLDCGDVDSIRIADLVVHGVPEIISAQVTSIAHAPPVNQPITT